MSVVENINSERVARVEAQVESIKEDVTEMKSDIKALNKKIDDANQRMVDHLDASIGRLAEADAQQHSSLKQSFDNVQDRVNMLERWKWMIVGGAIALGFAVGHSDILKIIFR